jgi:hypothetical protein
MDPALEVTPTEPAGTPAPEAVASPGEILGTPPAPSESPAVDAAPVESDEEPSDLSEPQKSNWKRLREARDLEAERARQLDTEYAALRAKVEPIEPVLDQLVSLGDALAPLDPDPVQVRETIRQISPQADRYLAGYYLDQYKDWLAGYATNGAFETFDALLQAASAAQAPPAQTQPTYRPAPTQGQGTVFADPRWEAQASFLDDDIRSYIEQMGAEIARVKELEQKVNSIDEAKRQAEIDAQSRQLEDLKTNWAVERIAQIDKLLEVAKVDPSQPVYRHVKQLVAMEMANDTEVNRAMTVGAEAHARGQILEAVRQARFVDQIVNKHFTQIASLYLAPAQTNAVARQQQAIETAQAAPKVLPGGASVPQAAPEQRNYSSDPEERRRQLSQTVAGFFKKQ